MPGEKCFVSVRGSTFETNSSSSHALVVVEGDALDLFFDESSVRRGVVELRPLITGYDQWMRLYRPENILTYLLIAELEEQSFVVGLDALVEDLRLTSSSIGYVDILPVIRRNFPVIDSGFRSLETATRLAFTFEFPGSSDIRDLSTGNLAPETGYLSDEKKLTSLLYGVASYVELNPENEWMLQPREIPTDLGTVDIVKDYDKKVAEFMQGLEDTRRMLEEMAERKRNE